MSQHMSRPKTARAEAPRRSAQKEASPHSSRLLSVNQDANQAGLPASTSVRPNVRTASSIELMTTREAAAYAKVSEQTVRRWVKADKLKIYHAGRQIRIDVCDLFTLLSAKDRG